MSLRTPFDLTRTDRDGLAVVAVNGELDCATAPELAEALAPLAEPGKVVLVDLRDTDFVDCAGIAPLVAAAQRQREMGGRLILDSREGPVKRFIDRTNLDQVVTLAGSAGPSASAAAGGSPRGPVGSRGAAEEV